MNDRINVWDSRTGEKLPQPVPRAWMEHDLFPHLTDKEPRSAASGGKKSADEKKEN